MGVQDYPDSSVVPTGAVLPFAGSSAPGGWLLCAGQEVAIAAYGELYAVLGTSYGSLTNGSGGAGSTHFRLPDLRGRVPAGVDNMGGSDAGRLDLANSLGTTAGSQTHTLTAAESGLPAHSHSVTDPGHSHTTSSPVNFAGTGAFQGAAQVAQGTTNSATTGISIANNAAANASSAHNNMQPTILLNYIIRAL